MKVPEWYFCGTDIVKSKQDILSLALECDMDLRPQTAYSPKYNVAISVRYDIMKSIEPSSIPSVFW